MTEADREIRDRLVRQRAAMSKSACPTCGHQPVEASARWQQRQDLAVVWLNTDADQPGQVADRRHCTECQPQQHFQTLVCPLCGDGPMIAGELADQMPDEHTPPEQVLGLADSGRRRVGAGHGGARVRCAGGIAHHVDHAGTARRDTVALGAITERAVVDALMGLPAGLPVAVGDLAERERRPATSTRRDDARPDPPSRTRRPGPVDNATTTAPGNQQHDQVRDNPTRQPSRPYARQPGL